MFSFYESRDTCLHSIVNEDLDLSELGRLKKTHRIIQFYLRNSGMWKRNVDSFYRAMCIFPKYVLETVCLQFIPTLNSDTLCIIYCFKGLFRNLLQYTKFQTDYCQWNAYSVYFKLTVLHILSSGFLLLFVTDKPLDFYIM